MDSAQKDLVEQAVEIIEGEFPMLAGVEDIADRLAVSKCHLIRCFGAALGTSPGKYLAATRLAAVRGYLATEQHSIGTIAGLTGFACGNYLAKVFRKDTGMTPLAYRELHSGTDIVDRTDLQKRSEDISFI